MIKLHDLSLGYGKRVLLSGVSCQWGAGQLTALIGRNGSGKSTLLRAICGTERPLAGTITIDGAEPSKVNPTRRARMVALVTSTRVDAPRMTAYEAVALARAPYTGWSGSLGTDDREAVSRALAATGTDALAQRQINSLSDGEMQRVMIARALAQETPVILLDEPTAPLDLPTRHQLVGLLRDVAHSSGRTVIMSTHELDIALRLADAIALIDSPRLILEPAQQMRESGVINQVFGMEV